jgi:Tol biopolymer transport system component
VWADFTGTPSPDGRYFSFVEWAKGDVAVYDLRASKYHYLTSQKPWSNPSSKSAVYSSAFSPDGSEVAYIVELLGDAGWELRIVAAEEENQVPPRTIFKTRYGKYPHVNDWSPEGKGILISFEKIDDQSGLGYVMPDTGKLTVLKTFERNTPFKARFSPDGRHIAYNFPPDPDKEANDIYLLTSDGSSEVQLVAHSANDFLIDWSPTGDRLIFISDRGGSRGIWAQPVAEGRAVGDAKLIKAAVGNERFIGITKAGHIYFQARKGLSDIFTLAVDPASHKITQSPRRLPSITEGKNRGPAWSPDGNYLAYRSGQGSYAGNLTIRSMDDGLEKEITTDSFKVAGKLAWSPDSKYILCNAHPPSRRWALWLFERSTEKFRLVREPYDDETILYPIGWSPDGKEIYFHSVFTDWSVLARNLETGVEHKIFQGSRRVVALSPDAQHLAVFERDGTNTTVKLISTRNGEFVRNLFQVPDPDSTLHRPLWSPDGRYIYFERSTREAERELLRCSSQGGEPEVVGIFVNRNGHISFSPDGRQLAFESGNAQESQELWVMENFLEPKQ